MATFSVNQTRQLYVVNSLISSKVSEVDPAGTVAVVSDKAKSHMYLDYKGAVNRMRSDLVNVKNIISAKATDADEMNHPLKRYTVTLDPDVNSGNPVAGQDYLLRIILRQYFGMSDEDMYPKYGMVHAYTGMTKEQFYSTLKESLVKNFSRELSQPLSFELDGVKATKTMTTNTGITVTAVSAGIEGNKIKFAVASIGAATPSVKTVKAADGTVTITASLTASAKTIKDLKALISRDPEASKYIVIAGTDGTAVQAESTAVTLAGGTTTGIVIQELPQEWILGTKAQVPVYFSMYCDTIIANAEERVWGKITEKDPVEFIPNGKKIADLEYFCMGERGDIYRNISWPNVIPTKYLVNSDIKYNVIDIHYFYTGDNEGVQKSEKTLTLVIPKVGDTNSVSNKLTNSVIDAINDATGLSIEKLKTN